MTENKNNKVTINEVMVRDGLQNEKIFVPTETKIDLVNRLAETGVKKIEVTSFVSEKAIPALRDAKELMMGIKRSPEVKYVVLVPNARGAERALECRVDEVNLVMSISESHNQANMRMSCDESLKNFSNIIQLFKDSGVQINGSIATTFGCPFEGKHSIERILWGVDQYLRLGMDSITLADTAGMAAPKEVSQIIRKCKEEFQDIQLTLHFHNTRGMALANAMAGLEAEVYSFDSSLGGIGGCPYAPGATGNVCTEDLVNMFEQCGISTGVDIGKLLPISRDLQNIVGHSIPSYILKAGLANS